ncbi:MAG TPA: MBL fold metallo-hydrolase, partial [Rhodothermales bacterium]|nr:MBL fold metallo-hydrolase [Rhodothermales bacterium]
GSVVWLHQRDRPLFVVPLGVGRHLQGWMDEPRVTELDWEEATVPEGTPLTVTALPARHFSGRTPFDRDRALWASFLIRAPGLPTLYFGGDSGYAPFYAAIRERHGAPDLALLPIGAYEPRWFMRPVHANPEEAVQAALELGARTTLGTHWGSFILTDEPMDEPPPRFLAEATRRGLDGRVLPVGGMLEIRAGADPSARP